MQIERITYTRRREQRLQRVCEQCHREYIGLARSRYCSNACKQRAAYQRHQSERQLAARRLRAQKRSTQQVRRAE